MKKILINYADQKYNPARRWNSISGKIYGGFDVVYQFKPEDIDSDFRRENQSVLSEKRGNGLWLWKPYFINRVLKECSDGDMIFYCDAGALFVRSLSPIWSSLSKETPFFVCDIPLIESNWTKPECFDIMGCDEDSVKFSNQIIGTYFAFLVTDSTRKFIAEWLKYCSDPRLIMPAGYYTKEAVMNIPPDMGRNFVAHREDQSIFSLLCKMNGIHPHADISQRRNDGSYFCDKYSYNVPKHENDKYAPIVYLHKCPSMTNLVLTEIYKFLKIGEIRRKIFK